MEVTNYRVVAAIVTRPRGINRIPILHRLDTPKHPLPPRQRPGPIAKARPKIPGTLGGLIEAYRASPEFREQLAPRTRSDYQKVFNYLATIESMPIVQIDEAAVIAFRDRAFLQRKRRFANYVVQVLRLLFSWGKPRASCRAPSVRSR